MATETETTAEYVHYHDGGIPGKRRILTGTDAHPTFNAVPKIDMQRMYSSNLSDRLQLSNEVGAACRDVGFFYAVNHGVDETLLDETFGAVKKYFDLPMDVKMECHNQKTEKFRGYEKFLEGKLDPSTRGADLKEGFLMGEDFTDPEQNLTPIPSLPATSKPRNQWPTDPRALFFRPAIYKYYNAMLSFSRRLLRIFALALSLPEDHFDAMTTHPMTNVRAVHYPPQTSPTDVGIGAHTDFCWFTLVCQSHTTTPALEVLNANGIWIPVHHEPHSFVVNIADFLKLVTGGTWATTVHRVRNIPGDGGVPEERYSMPFFFSPNEDARVSVLERFREEGKVYEEFVVGEYFRKRLDIDRTTHLDGEGEGERRRGYL
ncbi:2OG-Fe(II) oxygenase [Byssothecium circinans]|uniref:2OG-Fe(II) oxygenase n=1 Tax=Byssothecium circinans TaxID=147558 RepID=A0A6A5TEL9_9PLEO|nr:2OG-Fe(II) oxygenase [Byssothecium circinans]